MAGGNGLRQMRVVHQGPGLVSLTIAYVERPGVAACLANSPTWIARNPFIPDLKLRLLVGDRTEWSFAKKINEKYKVTKMVYRIPFYICRKQLNTTPGLSPMLAPPSLFSTKQLA